MKNKIVMVGRHTDTTIGKTYEIRHFIANGFRILDDMNDENFLPNDKEGILFNFIENVESLTETNELKLKLAILNAKNEGLKGELERYAEENQRLDSLLVEATCTQDSQRKQIEELEHTIKDKVARIKEDAQEEIDDLRVQLEDVKKNNDNLWEFIDNKL